VPPVLEMAPYRFECRVTDTVARDDHTVSLGVGDGVRDAARSPLTLRATGMNDGG